MKLVSAVTTVSSRLQAEKLARQVVEARLAACVQVEGPIQSLYHWKGEICADEEFRVTMHTMATKVDALRSLVISFHPYEVPSFYAVPCDHVHDAYLAWANAETQS